MLWYMVQKCMGNTNPCTSRAGGAGTADRGGRGENPPHGGNGGAPTLALRLHSPYTAAAVLGNLDYARRASREFLALRSNKIIKARLCYGNAGFGNILNKRETFLNGAPRRKRTKKRPLYPIKGKAVSFDMHFSKRDTVLRFSMGRAI